MEDDIEADCDARGSREEVASCDARPSIRGGMVAVRWRGFVGDVKLESPVQGLRKKSKCQGYKVRFRMELGPFGKKVMPPCARLVAYPQFELCSCACIPEGTWYSSFTLSHFSYKVHFWRHCLVPTVSNDFHVIGPQHRALSEMNHDHLGFRLSPAHGHDSSPFKLSCIPSRLVFSCFLASRYDLEVICACSSSSLRNRCQKDKRLPLLMLQS